MKVTIKLISGSYFFVGSIALKRDEEVELDTDLLTNTEKEMLLRYDTPPSYFETSHNLFEVLKVKELCDLPPISEQTSKPYAILISDDGKTISGYAEPGAEVTIINLSTSLETSKVVAGVSGFFTTLITVAIEDGASISVTAILPPKTKSEEVIAKADLPVVEPYDLLMTGLGTLTGLAQVGYTVTAEKGDEVVSPVITDSIGKFKFMFSKPLFSDMTVFVVSSKGDKTSSKVTINGSKTKPVMPTNVVITKDAISGTNGVEDDVIIKFKDGSLVTADKVEGSDVSFKHLISTPVYAPDSIELYGVKYFGLEPFKSDIATVVSTITEDLSIPSDFKWVSSLRLEGKTGVGSTVEGVTTTGVTLESLESTDGTFFLEFTKPLKVGETVSLTAKKGGEKSDSTSFDGVYVVEDPTDVVIAEDGTTITGKVLTGFKVSIKVNTKAAVEVESVGGVFNYTFPTPLVDKDKVQVRAIDSYSNKSEYVTYNFSKENPNKDIEFSGLVYFSEDSTEAGPAKHVNPGDTLYLHLMTKNLVVPQEVELEVLFKDASGEGSFETPTATIQKNGVTILPLVYMTSEVDTEMHTEVKIKGVTESRSQDLKVYEIAVKPVFTPSQGPSKIPVDIPFGLNFTQEPENYDVKSISWSSVPAGLQFTDESLSGLSVMAKVPVSTVNGTEFEITANIDGKAVLHSSVSVFDPYVPTNLSLSTTGDVLTGTIMLGVSEVLIYSKGVKVQTVEVSSTSFEITLDTPVFDPDFIEVSAMFNGSESTTKAKVEGVTPLKKPKAPTELVIAREGNKFTCKVSEGSVLKYKVGSKEFKSQPILDGQREVEVTLDTVMVDKEVLAIFVEDTVTSLESDKVTATYNQPPSN